MPRGIDRVDLAIARHIFLSEAHEAAFGILPTPWGIRAFPAARVRRGLKRLEQFWAEEISPDADPVWTNLRKRMCADESHKAAQSHLPGQHALSLPKRIARLGRSLTATGIGCGYPVRAYLPHGTAYINIGQITLAMPMLFNWLHDRPDIASVFMLHDVIPIQHPELVSAPSARHHARMVETAARFADGLIVSTNEAAASIVRELARCGCQSLPTFVRSLPLSNGFTRGGGSHPDLRETDYFVVCGTIEPRKNHALLMEVWQKLIDRDGRLAPHLIMVGTPGWGAERLLAMLDHSHLLQERIHHVAGLSTPALAQLIAGARALLVPSLAEGFSLPLLEARALGVPVIASDIPVHRERADSCVRLLPTDDRAGWVAAVDATPRQPTPSLYSVGRTLGEHAYCEDIVRFVQERLAAKLALRNERSPMHGARISTYMAGNDADLSASQYTEKAREIA